MNRITIRIISNPNIKVFISVDSQEVPIRCISKDNLEMWR